MVYERLHGVVRGKPHENKKNNNSNLYFYLLIFVRI